MTDSLLLMVLARLNSMVFPETEALVILFAVPPEMTENALALAVVVERFSL